ncbi:bifunctional cobalt-precorrin-7 (C(5))-methyltransferase/cobalt-precorrin-6B (C(15))-methyltransferase [Salidesulfovibrio brasiliensis]|uniref:bifunctional cobalt-precorrin-7 (C(5))-methyltransferase/cobalt-precorrin-6B (C(15))-methyltransferase n=1 Tax=Salidesulfovibrio brasiliensis TaxID=221711 RepID=UPI0006D06E2B|nr:bifunctional cobalt-precorrin-7 (C(5))-methyltransferase/cobalt-precorrin-6B (C(15))-methyltransferase [Salidesulfovibrio brasiliensis]
MAITEPVLVLGMSPGSLDLPAEGKDALSRATIIAGGRRLLNSLPEDAAPKAERLTISAPLDKVVRKLRSAAESGGRVVVLADGDPLFFGIGNMLGRELGRENISVTPALSTLQLAAARLGIPWERTVSVSLHGRNDFTPLFAALVRADTIAVFTDEQNDPAAVARAMLERGADGFTMTVLERLGTRGESVRRIPLEDTWGMGFDPLNIVFLEREYPPEIPLRLGIPDHYYFHQRGLITKLPVRSTGLALLAVTPGSTVWDLGAGCGSVAIEASHLVVEGHVVAVERDRTRAAMIRENQRRMGAWLVEVVNDALPKCLDRLPDPDRVFIGGGLGGESNKETDLLKAVAERLRPGGRVVAHCILLDTLHRTKAFFMERGWLFGVTQLQANEADKLAGDMRFKAANPVFVLWAEKP